MKLKIEQICDVLVNQYEHFVERQELVDAVADDLKDNGEVVSRASKLAQQWIDKEYIRYVTNLDIKDAEKNLREFIYSYLGDYL